MIDFFHPSEFQCRCGCGKGFEDMDPAFLEKLLVARWHADVPFVLSSAFRCHKHNAKVGGEPNSAHLYGMAVDIIARDDGIRFKILNGCLRCAGFTRFEIYRTWIHVDSDPTKFQSRLCYGSY